MTKRTFPDGTRIDLVEHRRGEREAILSLDGKKLSRTFIIPMFMRIGEAVVRMDGIGGVKTEEAFRNRGYSRRVLEACVDTMTSGDAAISTLYGIQDYYHKFGYITVGPEYTVSLPLAEDIPPVPSGWTFRPIAPGDVPAVMRIYHETTKRATGATRRHEENDEPDWVKRFAETSPPSANIGMRPWDKLRTAFDSDAKDSCKVLVDPVGEIVAYAWEGKPEDWWMSVRREESPNAFQVAEVMALSSVAADVIVSACRFWAHRAKPEAARIYLDVPPDSNIASAASYEGGSVLELYVRQGHFMARTIDPARLVNQMQPEFSARLRASNLNLRGMVTFRTDIGDASMSVTPEGVDADPVASDDRLLIELPQDMLARLCLGGFETSDLLERLPNRPDARTSQLMEVLFPRRHPHIYPLDRF
jgi:hypothetical protein